MDNVNLSQPWYTFANKIKYTYGLSPYVNVEDLVINGADYTLNIQVEIDDIAEALRAILPVTKDDFGGPIINIKIYNSLFLEVPVSTITYTPETLAQTLCLALTRNKLFIGTILTGGKLNLEQDGIVGDVAVVIENHVVQFLNYNIFDFFLNYSEVASKVFSDVSNLVYPGELKISFTTNSSKSELKKDSYHTDYKSAKEKNPKSHCYPLNTPCFFYIPNNEKKCDRNNYKPSRCRY